MSAFLFFLKVCGYLALIIAAPFVTLILVYIVLGIVVFICELFEAIIYEIKECLKK